MGVSEKHQFEGGLGSESMKWVIAGVALRTQLRPISTKRHIGRREREIGRFQLGVDDETATNWVEAAAGEEEEVCCTTPTGRETRIPERLTCPAAPRKQRPKPSTFHFFSSEGAAREFFNPPDLESVFIRHVERAG